MQGGLGWAGPQRNTAKNHMQSDIKMQVFIVGTVNSTASLFANPSPFPCSWGAVRFSFEVCAKEDASLSLALTL